MFALLATSALSRLGRLPEQPVPQLGQQVEPTGPVQILTSLQATALIQSLLTNPEVTALLQSLTQPGPGNAGTDGPEAED